MKDIAFSKNPFSIYDFLGYLFPGAFLVISLMCIVDINELSIPSILDFFQDKFYHFSFESSLYLVVVYYVVGHVLSYLSSITIERFSLWMFGYPSEFLMGQKTRCSYITRVVTHCGSRNCKSFRHCDINTNTILLRSIIWLLLSPIAIPYTLLSKFFSLKSFIVKPLDRHTRKCVGVGIGQLESRLGHDLTNDDVDYSRLIYHYYARKCPQFLSRTDNYVALYGFLRSSCLAFNILTIMTPILWINEIDHMSLILLVVSLSLISFILFLAFMKFYRRYSLEIFMMLISDDELQQNSNLKYSNYVNVNIQSR